MFVWAPSPPFTLGNPTPDHHHTSMRQRGQFNIVRSPQGKGPEGPLPLGLLSQPVTRSDPLVVAQSGPQTQTSHPGCALRCGRSAGPPDYHPHPPNSHQLTPYHTPDNTPTFAFPPRPNTPTPFPTISIQFDVCVHAMVTIIGFGLSVPKHKILAKYPSGLWMQLGLA